MCTVSVIPWCVEGGAGGVRLVCNRDESRRRGPAGVPAWHRVRFDAERPSPAPGRWQWEGRAIWPVDLEAGGTWVGASERGLVLALLNLNERAGLGESGRVSRGLVIPSLLGAPSAGAALAGLERMSLEDFAPLRLVAVEAGTGEVWEASWTGREVTSRKLGIGAWCFASSGLGDGLVQCRLPLFERIVGSDLGSGGGDGDAVRQDGFHRHWWSDRREVSVLMSRAEARTVSITTIEAVAGVSPRMRYEAVEGDVGARLEPRAR